MTTRQDLIRALERAPIIGSVINRHRQRRRQRDWATLFTANTGASSIRFYVTIGQGDMMVAKQFCEAFEDHVRTHGDPCLGTVVISAGAWDPAFRLDRGDHVVYWWWSMSFRDDWLDHYLDHVDVKPDVVACLSRSCLDYARQRGQQTTHLPLAVGKHFRPARASRRGIGFAGSRGHKDPAQEAAIIRPFAERADFEWVNNLPSEQDLAAFYNRKQIILGMTEGRQESMGMVNNRVFEVLATGTPFILHSHRAVSEVLGFDFPFQSSSPEQSLDLAERILAEYPHHLELFASYSREVVARHTYDQRIATLIECLRARSGRK